MNAVPLRPNKLPLAEAVANSPIAAGANVPLSIVPGNFFYVASASHPNFTIELNDEVKLSGRLALGHVFPEGVLITKFRVYNNDTSQALTIKVLVGRGAPIDNGLNVYTEQITPTVRTENPSSFSIEEVACTGVGNSLELLPLDCDRAYALLFTSAGGEAYYGPDATATWPTVDGNRIGLSLDNAQTRYQSCAALYVRGAVGTTVYAFVFGY